MGTNEMVGMVMVVGIPVLVSIMAIVKPIITLNTSITELNMSVKKLTDDNNTFHTVLHEHSDVLTDHEKRIFQVEEKIKGATLYGRRSTDEVHN